MNMEKTIRIAKKGIAEEFRSMEVEEVLSFPLDRYNFNSIRATPASTLLPDRLKGRKWKVKLDFDNGRVLVTRTA